MTTSTEQDKNRLVTSIRVVASSTAMVAGVFTVALVILLAAEFLRASYLDVSYQSQIASQRSRLHQIADQDEAIRQIRQLDLSWRRSVFAWYRFSHLASRTLFIAIGILILSIQIVDYLAGPTPAKPGASRPPARSAVLEPLHLASLVAVGVLGAVAAVIGLQAPVPGLQAQASAAQPSERHWYRFRGPEGAGISPYSEIPVGFDGPTNQGILWKTAIPLPGHSSPVLWEDRLFVTGADTNDCQVYCLDANNGQILWVGHVKVQPDRLPKVPAETGLAAPTMATDGRQAYAIFATGDLVAFDMAGRLVWQVSLGLPDSPYGYASSLEAFDGLVIVQFDQGQPEDRASKVIALDGRSGKAVWQVNRPVGASWTSPILARIGTAWQLITVANPMIIAYDPRTGQELWRAEAVAGDLAASPIAAEGLVLAVQPYAKLVAVKADGRGDVTKTHVAWENDKAGPEVCSPLCDGRYVYLLDSSGMLTAIDLKGQLVYQQVIDLQFKASPSLAGKELLLISEDGTMLRIAAGPEFKELARYQIGEECTASPAFSRGRIYIRGRQHIFCIATKGSQDQTSQ